MNLSVTAPGIFVLRVCLGKHLSMSKQLFDELKWRGFIHDMSDSEGLQALGPGTVCYVGFDPTAKSLQIGNLVQVMLLSRLGAAGWKPLMLFGGFTGAIGDPSGKNKERQLLSREEINRNIATQMKQVSAIAERMGTAVEFVNNFDWTKDMLVLDFLRDIGKHFTVNYMLQKESVKSRLNNEGISFTEFSYMLLQGYDFYHLNQTKDCKVQFGGSDQWGNITAGLELIRRKVGAEAFAFSTPLLTDSQGRKFGKSEGGAIWLDPALTSPYRFHQYWLNVDDQDTVKALKIFTDLSEQEIQALENEIETAPEKRSAQKALADAVCALVHGKEATDNAIKSAKVLFGGSMAGMSEQDLEDIFREVPSSTIEREELRQMTFLDVLERSGVVSSRGEGKRLMASGGTYLNNERVEDPATSMSDVAKSNLFVIRSGKKKYHLVKLSS